ncbi:Gfo/Idh/MocA family oxidoreductase [Streptomyces sp. LBUM 1476]|nr:Gfo/Idh/MocA family oxidoreductase [Streptomyces sp. LBUM 1476]
MRKVRWGLLVTGGYADVAMKAKGFSRTAEFVAVAADDAEEYARTWGIARAHRSREELLADDDVEAVFVALDPVDHAEWAVRALRAGKHVVVEKPLALSVADTQRVFDAAEEAGRVCVEGVFSRHHPQHVLAKRLVDDGVIGELRYIYAACTANLPDDYFRRFPERGGGGCWIWGRSRWPLSGCSPGNRSGCTRRRCGAAGGSTTTSRRPCGCPAMCWPSSRWGRRCAGATRWSWSGRPGGWSWKTRGSAGTSDRSSCNARARRRTPTR